MAGRTKTFFLVVFKKDGENVGHAISFDENKIPPFEKNESEPPITEAEPAKSTPNTVASLNFADVFESYISVMRSYRNFISLTLTLVPMISKQFAERQIFSFAKRKGAERSDLSSDDKTVYELDITSMREFTVYSDEIDSALSGAVMLPEVMIIGLVSAYDAFLTQLLRVIFNKRPELTFTSEKTIKFSELITLGSMDDARNSLIDREIESIMRNSHHDQFETLENKLDLKLKSDLPVWPKFVELCERRNLLTHTGGVVSQQYRSICEKHKFDTKDIKVGDRLKVDGAYFAEAVHIMSEIGMKLCWVLWRKFSKGEEAIADKALSEACYDLIFNRDYRTAEAILSFSTQILKKKGNDKVRRMMIVNLANAMRLQKNEEGAKKLLDSEDWSAVNDEIAVSVASVRGDVSEVTRLMKKIGKNGFPNIEDYRSWPVFRITRTKAQFTETFFEIFGEPVLTEETIKTDPTSKTVAPRVEGEPPQKTIAKLH